MQPLLSGPSNSKRTCPSARLDEPAWLPSLRADAEGVMTCPRSGWRYRLNESGQLRCLDWAEEKPLDVS